MGSDAPVTYHEIPDQSSHEPEHRKRDEKHDDAPDDFTEEAGQPRRAGEKRKAHVAGLVFSLEHH